MKTSFRIVLSLVFILSALPVSVLADQDMPPIPPDVCPPVCADTTPPVITPPADQSFATTSIPAFPVLIIATANDDTDPSPIITYSPLSFALGTTTVEWTATDSSGNVATTSSQVGIYEPPAPADTVTLALRDGDTLVGPFTVDLPSDSAPAVDIAATGTTTTHSVPARSVLALLSALDSAQEGFDITDLQYSSDFGAFYIACISVPSATSSPECYNWQYAVNGVFPFSGMDSYILANNDAATLFFGNSWQVSSDKSTATTEESFTASATKYDPVIGSYVAAPGVILGIISIPDPNTPWIYTEIATSTADVNGQATFTVASTGSYSIGISDSGYYPLSSITITAPVVVQSGGGGGGGGISHAQLNVPRALAYLSSVQNTDGSFASPALTGWAALAFAASDPGSAKTLLRSYLQTAAPTLSAVTDYERHAMSLMALGIDPYTGGPSDFISPIVAAFDGTQIGDTSLDNDDIFALFPLTHAGYGAGDNIIQKAVAFIVSRQAANGAWDGSIDVTAAAVQALAPLSSLPDVSAALTKAETYMRSQQQANGGFGPAGQANSFSTSWAMQAIAALGQQESAWAPGGYYPNDYLAGVQQSDGGVEAVSASAQTRTWATEYAIPGSLGKTWNALLSSFSKPAGTASGSTASAPTTSLAATATTTATSTSAVALAAATTTATTTPVQEVAPVAAVEDQAPAQEPPVPAPVQAKKIAVVAPLEQPVEPIVTATDTSPELSQLAAAASVGENLDWRILLAILALLILLSAASWKFRKKNN